jgi:signal transduction histidine kinase/CheY-like chemotaxis protein
VLYANGAAARILGAPGPSAVLGRDARDFHPVPDVALATAHDHMVEGRIRGMEVTLRRLDGSEVRVRVHCDLLEGGPAGASLAVTLEDVGEARLHAERDAQGRTMTAVGRLAGGMAHHFNNLLASIRANTALVREAASTDGSGDGLGSVREELGQIEAAARRASDIADLLLLVSGRRIEERSEVNAASWVYAAAGQLRERLPADVELVVRAEGGPLPIHVNETRLLQAVANLVRNAEEALTAGGRLFLESREVVLSGGPGEPAFVPPAPPGRYVSLEVGDTGLGMNADTLSRVLEPFFSTRRDREGAGLGLTMVYGIVAQMGGHFLIESAPLVGTRVQLLFPAGGVPYGAGDGADPDPLLVLDGWGGDDGEASRAGVAATDGPGAGVPGREGRAAGVPGTALEPRLPPNPRGPAIPPGAPAFPGAGPAARGGRAGPGRTSRSASAPDTRPSTPQDTVAGGEGPGVSAEVAAPGDDLQPEYDLVLVADDEESVRRVMEKILVRAGYRVVTAGNGREAQRVFRETESELALMVTDIMMPEMNGIELARWARGRIPDLPILLVSGFAESPLVQDWVDHEPGTFLAKPFEPQDFLSWVSKRVPISVS